MQRIFTSGLYGGCSRFSVHPRRPGKLKLELRTTRTEESLNSGIINLLIVVA